MSDRHLAGIAFLLDNAYAICILFNALRKLFLSVADDDDGRESSSEKEDEGVEMMESSNDYETENEGEVITHVVLLLNICLPSNGQSIGYVLGSGFLVSAFWAGISQSGFQDVALLLS